MDEIHSHVNNKEDVLKYPLFRGQFNGLSVVVKSLNEISLLYKWGCFGKGSQSRSRPSILQESNDKRKCEILRKRQFAKREEWVRKFYEKRQLSAKEKCLQNELDNLIVLIKESSEGNRVVIDLLSSDDEIENTSDINEESTEPASHINPDNIAIVVPNSDSEGDDYFQNFKPTCCFNKVKIEETLVLSLQEAYFLCYAFGCMQIIDMTKTPMCLEECWKLFTATEENFATKYIVYHYFRSKGYIVKPGIKFGGDYLLYKDGPGQGHADYIVIIKFSPSEKWLPIIGHIRMAGTTSKLILQAEVIPNITSPNSIKPNDLCKYKVREMIWSRKIPCNNEEDE